MSLVLPRFDTLALCVWERNLTAWRKIYATSVLLNFGEPLMNLLALGFGLGAYVTRLNGVPFAAYIAPGLLMSTVMMGVTFDTCFTVYGKLHRNRVYDAMVTGPVEVESIVAGELLWEATRALLYGTTFLIVILALGLVKSALALAVLPLAVVSSFIFVPPALLVASLARLEEHIFYYVTLVITPMFMFSGIFFPVERLPQWAQIAVWFTPLYHLVRVSRALVLGQVDPALGADVAWLLVVALLFLPLPGAALKKQLLD